MTIFYSDTFGRTVASGSWGVPEVGATNYVISGSAPAFSVPAGLNVGRISLVAGGNNAAIPTAGLVPSILSDFTYAFALSAVPLGANIQVFFFPRYVSSSAYYRCHNTVLATSGNVNAGAQNWSGVSKLMVVKQDGSVGDMPLVLSGYSAAGPKIRGRVQAFGTNPVLIRNRVWFDGDTEPSSWMYQFTDYEPTIQAAGGVAVGCFAGGALSNGPIDADFSELVATDLASGLQTAYASSTITVGDWAPAGGAATIHQALNDQSNTTYITGTTA